MHITCDHCGSTIDIDKDKVCPNCGAPYHDNKEYKSVKDYHNKNKEYDLKDREASLESKQLANEVAKKALAGPPVIVKIFLALIFIMIITMFIFMAIRSVQFNEHFNDDVNEIDDGFPERVKEEVTVGFNELAQTDDFEIKCDKITEYVINDYESKEFKNSYLKIYNFEIVFTNKTETAANLGNIKLTYTDNDGNENILAKKHDPFFNHEERVKELDDYARDTLTHKGTLAFEIPKDTKDVKIIYENATIKMDDFKSLIK